MIISLLTAFWQVAITSAQVAESTRRIELLEAADRQRGDSLSRIDARTARIEATLDIIRGGPVERRDSTHPAVVGANRTVPVEPLKTRLYRHPAFPETWVSG